MRRNEDNESRMTTRDTIYELASWIMVLIIIWGAMILFTD